MDPQILSELTELDSEIKHQPYCIDNMQLLLREINLIIAHKIQPSKDWYASRMTYVAMYRAFDWTSMIATFKTTNSFMHNQTIQLVANMIAILMQWQVGITCLKQYQFIMYYVNTILQYYHTTTEYTLDQLVIDMTECSI